MKKFVPIAAALVLALAGCSSKANDVQEPASEPEVVQEEENATVEPESTIEWTDASSAEEAAKGAGMERFGVVTKFTIGDLTFENPSFAYAGGVAQATYETPATAVYLRKAQDSYSTPLSDRALDEFAARWNKVYDGVDVACYGLAKGAVTVATWTDGDTSYGLTFQGLGGEEMSMDTEELFKIVKGFNEANADQTPDDNKKAEETKTEDKSQTQQQSTTTKGALLSDTEAEALVEKTCGGTCTSIDRVTTKQYGECWYAMATDANGNRFEYYVNNDGIYLIDEKGAQKEQTTPTNSNSSSNKTSGGHYEGEPVSIYGSIYAEWHQANGEWYATFVTYNGTQIFAQEAPAGGGWVFYALSNGKSVQVIYSDQESSATGEYGPAGVSSHWTGLDGNGWY